MHRAWFGWMLAGLLLVACGDDEDSTHDAAAAMPDAGHAHSPGSGGAGAHGSGGSQAIGSDASASSGGGGSPAQHDAGMPHDIGADAGDESPRPFLLASAGTQLLVTGPSLGLQLTEANLADDVDLVSVHQEFYGVPWQALLDGTDPPAEWSAKMQALADHAHAISKRVFVSISMLNGARETLASRTTIDNGQVKSEDNWAAHCYDFGSAPDAAQMRAAYLKYVDLIIDVFAPTYLNVAIEVNLFLEKCPDAAAGVIDMSNAAYAEAKKKDPALLAFPSFQIDHLYGYAKDSCPDGMDKDACFDANYAQITGFQRDRFAMSSYPYMQGQSLKDLRADWFERAPARGGERALIAETGWLSTNLVAQNGADCTTVITSDEQTEADYLSRVLSDADRIPLELVTWWSNRDLLPAGLMTNCPCDYDATWCGVVDQFRAAAGGPLVPGSDYIGEILLKAFGTMGIRDYDGKLKPKLAQVWDAAR